MVKITKEEAKLVRERLPYVHIYRTVHKYYMEENRRAMEMLGKKKPESRGRYYGSR